jgi:DNA invertase Pin-like site-specific DNA recombinase
VETPDEWRVGAEAAAQVCAMKAQGLGASEIAKALKIGRASVYRVLEAG